MGKSSGSDMAGFYYPGGGMQTQQPTVQTNSNPDLPTIRTTGREYVNPVDYQHPDPSMARFAELLALRYDANRTRHAYYRHLRLIHQHCGTDPAAVTAAQLRDYFLRVKLQKRWQPKSIRQARAAARLFFVGLLAHTDWRVFAQIRAKDHDALPAVLTRQQVHDLLAAIRLRRYRTPLNVVIRQNTRLQQAARATRRPGATTGGELPRGYREAV